MEAKMKILLLALFAAVAAAGKLETKEKRQDTKEGGDGQDEVIIPPHDWRVRLDDPVEIDPNFDPAADSENENGQADDNTEPETFASHWVDRSAENLPAYGWSVSLDQPDYDTEADEDDVKRAAEDAEDVDKRIISGQRANYGEHPYICSLQRWSNGVWYHTCGSVIYNENTIMTAAHCVSWANPSYLRVKCGEFRLRRTDQYEQIRRIQTIRVHPGWSSDGSRGFPNDLAVLQTTSSLTFNNYVNTLTVDDGSTSLATNCVILGWGRTEWSGSRLPSRLRDVTIARLTNEECTRRWGSRLVNNGHICFKDRDYDGACNGDSGGPAVCGNRLVGVTSYGIRGCISTYYPSVYTRLSFFYDWIVANAF